MHDLQDASLNGSFIGLELQDLHLVRIKSSRIFLLHDAIQKTGRFDLRNISSGVPGPFKIESLEKDWAGRHDCATDIDNHE